MKMKTVTCPHGIGLGSLLGAPEGKYIQARFCARAMDSPEKERSVCDSRFMATLFVCLGVHRQESVVVGQRAMAVLDSSTDFVSTQTPDRCRHGDGHRMEHHVGELHEHTEFVSNETSGSRISGIYL